MPSFSRGFVSNFNPGVNLTRKVEEEMTARFNSPLSSFAEEVSSRLAQMNKPRSPYNDYRGHSVEEMRTKGVDWGRTYLWDLKVPSAPPPFDSWFPAIEATPVIGKPSAYFSIDGGQSQYRILEYTMPETFRVVVVDDTFGTLEKWLRNWTEENFNMFPRQIGNEFSALDASRSYSGGSGVGLLGEIVRPLHFMKLNSQRQPIEHHWMLCFPHGEQTTINNSETGPKIIDIMFEVARKRILK